MQKPQKKQAYVIRHVAFEDLGSFEDMIATRYDIHYMDAGVDNLQTPALQESRFMRHFGWPY